LERSGKEDRWVNISEADYQFLTGAEPESVAYLYEAAIAGASAFEIEAVRRQLEIFEQLALLPEQVTAALSVVPKVEIPPPAPLPRRMVLFTGHMIDAPDRANPRFPASAADKARAAILGVLRDEVARTKGDVVGIAFAACGGAAPMLGSRAYCCCRCRPIGFARTQWRLAVQRGRIVSMCWSMRFPGLRSI
jgi:hypothetical protein